MQKVVSHTYKITMVIVLIISLCCVTAGACYAVFSREDSATPTVNPAVVSVQLCNSSDEVVSDDGVTANGEYKLKNTSPFSVVMRAKPILGTGTTFTISSTDSATGWTLVEDGFYYYNNSVNTNGIVSFGTISNYASGTKIVAEVIQSNATAFIKNWGLGSVWHSGSTLGSSETTDGISLEKYNGDTKVIDFSASEYGPLIPDGNSWKVIDFVNNTGSNANINNQFSENPTVSTGFLAPLTDYSSDNVSLNITSLTGTGTDNSYFRLYNNTSYPMVMAFTIHASFYLTSNNETYSASSSPYSNNVTLTYNMGGGSTNWFNYDSVTLNSGVHTEADKQMIYKAVIMPGESVKSLLNNITISGITGYASGVDSSNIGNYAVRISVSFASVSSGMTSSGTNSVAAFLDDVTDLNSSDKANLATLLATNYYNWLNNLKLNNVITFSSGS